MTTQLIPSLRWRRVVWNTSRLLDRRWVKILLFLTVFLAVWLSGTPTAHAAAPDFSPG